MDFKINTKSIEEKAKAAARKKVSQMDFDVECPHCHKSITIPQGKHTCPFCRKIIDLTLDINF